MGCNVSTSNSKILPDNCVLYWNSKYKTQKYHWWPLLQSDISTEDKTNNLYAKGGGLDKYDNLFDTNSLIYQKKYHSIPLNSKRDDKNWAGFCDRAAMLSCLYRYPIKPVIVKYKNKVVEFDQSDIESLMIIVSETTICPSLSVFYGSRNNIKNETSKKFKETKGEPLPLNLLEILRRFSKEDEPFVIDIDNGSAVWNYPFDSIYVTIEPIDYSDERIPKKGKNVVYRFKIESMAYPEKNIDICGLVTYQEEFIHQKWLSESNPDFLWKNYSRQDNWRGLSDINPNIDSNIVYKIYKESILGKGESPVLCL